MLEGAVQLAHDMDLKIDGGSRKGPMLTSGRIQRRWALSKEMLGPTTLKVQTETQFMSVDTSRHCYKRCDGFMM